MIFQIIDWNDRCIFHDYNYDNDSNEDDNEENEEKYYYSIQIFGKNENQQSICLNVFNIFPYFYVKNAYISKTKYKYIINNEIEIPQFYINDYENIQKQSYSEFKNNSEESFLKLSFKSPIYLNKIKKILEENNYQLFESNVNGIIQFIHDNNLSGCSWISVEEDELEIIEYDKISKCDLEYNLYDNSEISVVEKDEIVKLKICSYDIEVTSEDGSFPQARRPGDKIIQIGMTFNYFQEQNCYKKYLLNLNTCDNIEGTEVICVNEEKDLIKEFISIINKEDPDVICGYNIFGFDNKYMHDRTLTDEKYKEILSTMSRLNAPQKFVTKELSSSALGDNILYYFKTPGRVMIDLLKVVRNTFSLEKYSLDFVSSYLISGKINEISNKYFISNTKELEKDSFCSIKLLDVISNTEELYEKKLKIVKTENNKFFFTGDISNLQQKDNIKWCLAKDDLSPKDIFEYFEKTSYHRSIIGKYCIKDCVLVNKLMEKIDVVSNSIAMANVCKVPWNYIFLRGQGIKAFSLIKYQANSENYLFPTITKDSIIYKKQNFLDQKYTISNKKCCNESCITNKDIYKPSKIAIIEKNKYNIQKVCIECNQVQYNTKYDGAHVIDPIPGYYTEPIIVMDFASLYPSSIIQKNMSGETQILDTKYLNLNNCIYHDIEYNEDKKKKICCFVKKDNKLGIIPTTLQNLLSERKAIKKKMKNENNEFKKKILDGQQLAMKITANSIYGQMGAITSPIYLKDIAASTTATGKEMLLKAEDFMTERLPKIIKNKSEYQKYLNDKEIDFLENFNSKFTINPLCVYGDSVAKDTPILIKDNQEQIQIIMIEELCNKFTINEKGKKEGISNKKIWTNNKWSPIKRVIKHKTNKCMYRVKTNRGIVDVTEDHSLIDTEMNLIKPKDCSKKTKLLHSYPYFPKIYKISDNFLMEIEFIINKNYKDINDYAFALGIIYCSPVIFLGKINHKIKFKTKIETLLNFRFYLSDCENYLIPCSQKLLFNIHKFNNILNKNYEFRYKFFLGWYIQQIIGNKVQQATIYYIMKSIGLQKELSDNDFLDIENLSSYENNYVYDLETEDGIFQAGIGEIIVKNTDSVFISLNIKDIETKTLQKDIQARENSIKIGFIAEKLASFEFPYPQFLEYEKVYHKWAIFSKKKYTGRLYETDPNKFYVNNMGIVLKRRDNAKIVKKICGSILHIMFTEKDYATKCKLFVKNIIKEMFENKFDLSYFTITKTLRSTYKGKKLTDKKYNCNCSSIKTEIISEKHSHKKSCKYVSKIGDNGTWKWDDCDCSIAHVKLCQRMKQRDIGSAPNSNDRISYVYIINKQKNILQADRIEELSYVKKHNLEIDYQFYIDNQIKNPCIQFLELFITNPEYLFTNSISENNVKQMKITSYF